jgi:hypothetical protein
MNLSHINNLLGVVKAKLESLDPAKQTLAEAQKKPEEHSANRMSAARKRMKKLYDKNTAGRSDATRVKGTGAKR